MTTRALHVGINQYRGSDLDLAKCVADARALSKLFGGRLLLDAKAKRAEILDSIADTVAATQAGEWCVITYSGHGSQAKDQKSTKEGGGDEPDGLDETLVAADLLNILDDEIPPLLAKLNRRAAGGVFVTDSCYSGTAHRATPTLGREHLAAIRKKRIRYLPPSLTRNVARVANVGKQPALPKWVHIAGCTDFEYSYEGPKNGVLTDALVTCYSKAVTIGEWFKHAAEWVAAGEYGRVQHPQLNCSAAMKRLRVPSL